MNRFTMKQRIRIEGHLCGRMTNFAIALASGFLLLSVPGTASAQKAPGTPSPAPKSVAPAPAAPVSGDSCDAACIRAHSDAAARACAPQIESKAPGDFEWVSRPYGNIFQEAAPAGKGALVNYRGDSIRFQSPQRDWVRVSYDCAFDTAAGKVAEVNVRLGRLNAPAAPPPKQAAEAPRPQPQHRAAAPARQKRVKVGEPSDVEVMQVTPNAIRN